MTDQVPWKLVIHGGAGVIERGQSTPEQERDNDGPPHYRASVATPSNTAVEQLYTLLCVPRHQLTSLFDCGRTIGRSPSLRLHRQRPHEDFPQQSL